MDVEWNGHRGEKILKVQWKTPDLILHVETWWIYATGQLNHKEHKEWK